MKRMAFMISLTSLALAGEPAIGLKEGLQL
jgi:hypothetical protein